MSRRRRKSTFWTNFWRETGKNTGKWTSNKVFGNSGWSTPRRHIFDNDSSNSNSKSQKSSFLESVEKISNSLNDKKVEENKEDRAERKELLMIEYSVEEDIKELSIKKIPKTEEDLIEVLFEIEVLLKSNKWKETSESFEGKCNKLKNKYANALLTKYIQCVELFELKSSNELKVERFNKKIKYFKRKKFFYKYKTFIFFILGMLVFITLLLVTDFLS